MRISKEPEERKQEILETAMRLFSINGFEKTSISDIAKEMGVAQGLCYRYFPSKDILFQTAVNEYASILVSKMTAGLNIKQSSLKQILNTMASFTESKDDIYYSAFHDKQNKNFHDLLSVRMCELLVPVVSEIIETANANHEIDVPDVQSYASFCVFGQLGILMDETLSSQEKADKIKSFLLNLFKI